VSAPTGGLIPHAIGAPVLPDEFVIVTHYRRAHGRPAVIHAYGPYSSRERAETVLARMRCADQAQYGDRALAINYWVRKIMPESPTSARAGQATP
jgi:hypothetical protein